MTDSTVFRHSRCPWGSCPLRTTAPAVETRLRLHDEMSPVLPSQGLLTAECMSEHSECWPLAGTSALPRGAAVAHSPSATCRG